MIETLWNETIEDLREHGKTFADVRWIGTRDARIPLDSFRRLADVVYDSDYGGQRVAADLLVVGDDWWMERHEYDGSEWWEFKTMPVMPERAIEVRRIIGGAWDTLKEMNA